MHKDILSVLMLFYGDEDRVRNFVLILDDMIFDKDGKLIYRKIENSNIEILTMNVIPKYKKIIFLCEDNLEGCFYCAMSVANSFFYLDKYFPIDTSKNECLLSLYYAEDKNYILLIAKKLNLIFGGLDEDWLLKFLMENL